MSVDEILNEYDQKIHLNREFSQSMVALVSALISSSSIQAHSITSRVKDKESLSKKIKKKDKYTALNQLTDIVGLRVITNYSDEVDTIAAIIEREFQVDEENSIDKRATLDPDRFGYLSLHYVISLNSNRGDLIEYQRFSELKFEIQIRSILQHTWAEIEHDIGYKTKIEIPKKIRRQFSRLAGLLEIADDQFINIREDLKKYEKEVQENITKSPEFVEIDAVSILEFIITNVLVQDLDKTIAEECGFKIQEVDKSIASRHIKYLKYFGIESISQLAEEIEKNKNNILLRVADIKKEGDEMGETASRGLSIFYLHQVLAAKMNNIKQVREFLDVMGMAHISEREGFSEYLYELSKKFV